MRTNVVEKGKWEREVAVEVPAKRIDAELQRAYQKYQKRVEVRGFRKGKAPIPRIKALYGDRIRDEVLADLLPRLVQEAARDTGLVPAAPPAITDLQHQPGQDLRFTMSFDVWPELGEVQYRGLKASHLRHQVTEEEVDGQLQVIRNRQATEHSVERPLHKGDVLLADLQRLDDSGLPIIGEKFEERRFVIGEADAPSPQFEEALLGISAGEERSVRFAYRPDLLDSRLAGTVDHFRVTARQVHERLLPELDDEFAKDMGERFGSLEDLRRDIRRQLEQSWELMGRQRMHGQLVERLIHSNPFEMPPSAVRNYLEEVRVARQRRRQRERGAGRDHDHDHEQGPGGEPTEDELRDAERSLRALMLLEAVKKQAGVTVTEEELGQYVAQRAAAFGVKAERLPASSRLEMLRDLEDRKVMEVLRQHADITEERA
ncbi:MAG: trigger factor [Candidatus Latescibacterota bacterium]